MEILIILFLLYVLRKGVTVKRITGPRPKSEGFKMPKRVRRSTSYGARLGRRTARKDKD